MLLAKDNSLDRELIPAGNMVARCYMVADCGTQVTKFTHETTGLPVKQHQVVIAWEFPAELMKDGRPFARPETYTLALGEKANLRKILDSWLGRPITDEERKEGFDLKQLLGKPCMVNIIHKADKGRIFANIASVGTVPRGMTVPEPVNKPLYFEIGGYQEDYRLLPEWIRKKIDMAEEQNPPEEEEQHGLTQEEVENVPF